MSRQKYEHLMRPLVVRGHVFKNRMCAANSLPHFLQGPESYPADSVFAHYENKAKGAAVVTCMGINNNSRGIHIPGDADFVHFPDFDMFDPTCRNYLMQLADAIHYYHSVACMSLYAGPPAGYPVKRPVPGTKMTMPLPNGMPQTVEDYKIEQIPAHNAPDWYTPEQLNDICESYAMQAEEMYKMGFEMGSVHLCYRNSLPSQFFSPLTNHRIDEFGGSLENRMRFPLMVLQRIRERVGKDYILEIQWSANDNEGGYTMEESAEFLRRASKYIDIVQVRTCDIDPAHPTGFMPEEIPFLDLAGYVKEHVPNLIVGSIAGYQDLKTCDDALATGKCDLIYAARAFISNSNYGELLRDGRNDDIVPCVRCNKCHGRGMNDPYISVCTVNPEIGLEHKLARLTAPVTRLKKIAVIGGGPAGMRAAMYLKDRGHTPVIFESGPLLGGKIIHSDYVDFKWPLKRFKDFLIYQVGKKGIEVRLNTAATPEMIAAENFDAVVVAVGALEITPPIKGIRERKNVYFARQLMEDPALADSLGERIAVIGGGEVGVECGIYMARRGRAVNVLEMRPILAADSTMIHYYSMFKKAWEDEPSFHGICNARVVRATDDAVVYVDADGNEQSVPADAVVLSCGMKSLTDEALSFYGSAPEFYMIGDCEKPATIQQAMRSAYGTANQI